MLNNEPVPEETMGSVEEPCLPPWPGANFEEVMATPGFMHPETMLALLNERCAADARWSVKEGQRASVEGVYELEQAGSPLEIRARIAGSGAHPDADFVQYVFRCKFILMRGEDACYADRELCRGSAEEVVGCAARLPLSILSNAGIQMREGRAMLSDAAQLDAVSHAGRGSATGG